MSVRGVYPTDDSSDSCVSVPQDIWEKVIHSLEFDVTWGYRNDLMRSIRYHFDGPDETD